MSEHEELCDFLRAKVGANHNDKRALFALRHEATTVYWCLLTMSPAGPDDKDNDGKYGGVSVQDSYDLNNLENED